MSKTSTFTVHHDRCDPSQWKPGDVLQFAKFVQTGDLRYAAHLSRLGFQLVLSEHHVPKGGEIEHVGWTKGDSQEIWELDELAEDDITSLHRVYRGPEEHVVRVTIGNEDGDVEGHEYEIKPTLAEAEEYLKRVYEPLEPA